MVVYYDNVFGLTYMKRFKLSKLNRKINSILCTRELAVN